MFQRSKRRTKADRRIEQLQQQLADEQAGHLATKRLLRIAEVEIESLSAVIARDRARVEAEAATYARNRADSEGLAFNGNGRKVLA